MDNKGPGSLRGLGSFEGVRPPFIDLTLCRRPKHARSRLTSGCIRTRSDKPQRKRPQLGYALRPSCQVPLCQVAGLALENSISEAFTRTVVRSGYSGLF